MTPRVRIPHLTCNLFYFDIRRGLDATAKLLAEAARGDRGLTEAVAEAENCIKAAFRYRPPEECEDDDLRDRDDRESRLFRTICFPADHDGDDGFRRCKPDATLEKFLADLDDFFWRSIGRPDLTDAAANFLWNQEDVYSCAGIALASFELLNVSAELMASRSTDPIVECDNFEIAIEDRLSRHHAYDLYNTHLQSAFRARLFNHR